MIALGLLKQEAGSTTQRQPAARGRPPGPQPWRNATPTPGSGRRAPFARGPPAPGARRGGTRGAGGPIARP
eukprot:11200920-Lingulodinium_polyedra.AAC.1